MMTNVSKAYIFAQGDKLYHTTGCLIQGLCDLGIRVGSNVSPSAGVISNGIFGPFSKTPIPDLFEVHQHRMDEDVLIICTYDTSWMQANSIVQTISAMKPVLLLNMHDSANFVDYPKEITAFVTHVSRFARREGNIYPVGFNLANDIIQESAALDLDGPRSGIVRNFNNSSHQELRLSLDLILVPQLERYFKLDKRSLPHAEYATQITQSLGVLAYGGSYYAPYMDYLMNSFSTAMRKQHTFREFTTDVAILRWDSWRFWESCVMGAAPFQLDFEKYGFVLPVMPKPWVEYIPIDLSDVPSLINTLRERVQREPDFFQRIGRNARKWAIEHYSPVSLAKYVMKSAGLTWAGAAG